MRFPHLFAALSLTTLAVACSSDSPSPSKQPSKTGDSGAGDGGSASGGKGGSSSGGKGSGGASAGGQQAETGGANPADCEIDSGTDPCRLCLASHCCDDFKGCTADADCATAFDTYQTCVHGSKGDGNIISECFSTFAAAIATKHAAFNTCDYNCSKDCGGPLAL